jgi:hypothetical protein
VGNIRQMRERYKTAKVLSCPPASWFAPTT